VSIRGQQVLGFGDQKTLSSHGWTPINTDKKPETPDFARGISGEPFWARQYAVSTVGFEPEQVRQYIREQEAADGTNGQF
jgi:REP element-mobilizing transposase RayT